MKEPPTRRRKPRREITPVQSSTDIDGAELDREYLRAHTEADRQAAEAEAAGDNQIAAALDDVAIGIAVAEARGHDRRIAEQADLAAMSMAGECQGHAAGDLGENVGLVGQEDDRRVV